MSPKSIVSADVNGFQCILHILTEIKVRSVANVQCEDLIQKRRHGYWMLSSKAVTLQTHYQKGDPDNSVATWRGRRKRSGVQMVNHKI